MTRSLYIAMAVLWVFATSEAAAQTSKELAAMAPKAWAAFVCSTFAGQAKKEQEEERLFLLGYQNGKTFIEAARAGKIREEDFRDSVPIGVSLVSQGPNADFIVGRIYENASDDAMEKITNPLGKYRPSDEWASAAEQEFLKGNCALL